MLRQSFYLATFLGYTLFAGLSQSSEIRSSEDAGDYLQYFGYVPNNVDRPDEGGIFASKREWFRDGISTFQEFTGLKPTGIFDKETETMMNRPRCGISERMDLAENRFMNSTTLKHKIPRGRWKSSTLRYKFKNFPNELLDSETVKREIRRAFQLWENAADIRCIEVPPNDHRRTELVISFARGEHGDGNAFGDASVGNVVAHAFFPNHRRFKGSIHFDREREWTAHNISGINLYQVAAHEIGHALGLDHSRFPQSVMHMIVHSMVEESFQLHEDDIKGIQNLYGPRQKKSKRPKRPPPSIPDSMEPPGTTHQPVNSGRYVAVTTSQSVDRAPMKEGTILYGLSDLENKQVPVLEDTLHEFWKCFALTQQRSTGATDCYAKNVARLLYSLEL